MERILGREFREIVIVGGGAKDELLNTLTARYTGKKITPLPIEATAIGNLKSQMEDAS
jgi:rhamnulokinase